VVRGFKTKAKKESLAIRKEIGIDYNEPLDCFRLVESLEIPAYPVEKMGEFGLCTELINTICYAKGKQQFSATTISVPLGHLIFYNQTHTFERTNSSLAHEASHVILGHEFSSILDMKMVSREFDKDKEDEANWMAGCLLLPEDGLIWALKKKMSIESIADHYNISKQMTQWRYNSTGMRQRMKYVR
jgi:Zn-dependent peptidase ImmA (M78 family)